MQLVRKANQAGTFKKRAEEISSHYPDNPDPIIKATVLLADRAQEEFQLLNKTNSAVKTKTPRITGEILSKALGQ